MGFFNDLGKKTSEATSKITKETKLKLKMGDNKSKINSAYQEIGKKVYEKYVNNESLNLKEELKEEFEKIDTLAKEIEEARLEVLKLNNKRLCPNCFAEVEKTSAFCPKCGGKLEAEQEVVEKAPEEAASAEEKPEEEKKED